jgi:hypothetical protein
MEGKTQCRIQGVPFSYHLKVSMVTASYNHERAGGGCFQDSGKKLVDPLQSLHGLIHGSTVTHRVRVIVGKKGEIRVRGQSGQGGTSLSGTHGGEFELRAVSRPSVVQDLRSHGFTPRQRVFMKGEHASSQRS